MREELRKSSVQMKKKWFANQESYAEIIKSGSDLEREK